MKKETQTFERHDIENTPFSAIKILPEGKCKLALGNFQISKKEFKNIEEVHKWLKKIQWELIFNTIALVCNEIINNKLNEKEQNHD